MKLPLTLRAATTSRANRARKPGLAASSARISFTATSRPPATHPPHPAAAQPSSSRYFPACTGSPGCSASTMQ